MENGRLIAGMDIGNSTTEVVIIERTDSGIRYHSGTMTATTGVKGTKENVAGCIAALDEALQRGGLMY